MAGAAAILQNNPNYLTFDAVPSFVPPPSGQPASALAGKPASALADPGQPVADDAQGDKSAALRAKLDEESAHFTELSDSWTKYQQGMADKVMGAKLPDLTQVEQTLSKPFQAPKQGASAQAWAGVAIAVAALGSLLTRRPLTTAMTAMAGAINAYRKGEQDQLDNSYKIWQANTENALKLGNFEMEAYRAAT